jgi:hypothetical protein
MCVLTVRIVFETLRFTIYYNNYMLRIWVWCVQTKSNLSLWSQPSPAPTADVYIYVVLFTFSGYLQARL